MILLEQLIEYFFAFREDLLAFEEVVDYELLLVELYVIQIFLVQVEIFQEIILDVLLNITTGYSGLLELGTVAPSLISTLYSSMPGALVVCHRVNS